MSLTTIFGRRAKKAAALCGLAGAILAGSALTGAIRPAVAATPEEIKAKGTLSVGVLTDYPPFGGTDAQQQPAGYDADVAALMAKSLGVKLELVPVTGPNRIPYLLTNKVDVIIATLGITAERGKQVAFSQPYSALTIYVLAPKSMTIQKPEDLKGVSVAVARASTQDTSISAIAPPGTDIKRYDDDATALQALISGQVKALGASNTILAQLNKDYPQLQMEPKITLKEQANGMAFRKSDTALLDYANKFIAGITANGELSKINQKWFGTPLKSLPPMPNI